MPATADELHDALVMAHLHDAGGGDRDPAFGRLGALRDRAAPQRTRSSAVTPRRSVDQPPSG